MLNTIIKIFGNIFKDKIKKNDDLNETYFHEDFFKQVEFCPKENFEYLKCENKKIRKFSEEHSDGNELFTDVYLRNESANQKSVFEKQILIEELDLILLKLGFKKIVNVYSGYGSFKEKHNNIISYKFDRAEIFVVLEVNFVRDIFITGFRFHENENIKSSLEEILNKIGKEYDLVLNDWDLAETINLNNINEIKKYLNEEL